MSLSIVIVLLFKRSINSRLFVRAGNYKTDVSSIVVFILLSFFAVFRRIEITGIGGTDAASYLQRFRAAGNIIEYLTNTDISQVLHIDEPLFKIYNMLIRSVTSSEHVYLLISYGLIIVSLISFVKFFYNKESFYLSLILVTCAYLYSFNIMRTWISLALCVYAFKQIIYNRWIKSAILIVAAGLIHTMAFVFLLVWLICLVYSKFQLIFSTKTLLTIVLLSNLICVLAREIVYTFIMSTKYSYYEKLFAGSASLLGYLPGIFICVASIFLFDRLRIETYTNEIERNKKVYCILALTINLSCMYLIVGMFAWRINDFFLLIRMFMLSIVYEFLKRYSVPNKKIYILGLIGFTLILYLQQMLGLQASSGIFPYSLSFIL